MARFDFGNIVPEEYIVSIKGVDVDLSIFTTRMVLAVQKKIRELGHAPNEEESIDLVVEICQMKNPDFTKDLVMELDATKELKPFINAVMGAFNKSVPITETTENGDTKNSIASE